MAEQKRRHECLTAWLGLVIIYNFALLRLLFESAIRQYRPDLPWWALPASAVLSMFDIVCVIALLMWKKWGFWGICGLNVVALIVNLLLDWEPYSAMGRLLGVAILYGVLQIGKENKGWPQLD